MNIYRNSSSIKIGVFYDGNFFLHASNYYNYVHPQRKRLSITGIHNFIKKRVGIEQEIESRKCQIVEAHYFRGRINATEASQRGSQLYNDRVFDDILMSEGIHAHYLPLRNLLGRKEGRGIDVWLSLEVYELSLMGKLDMVVLIVSDTDYVPLVRKLNALGLDIMLLSWEFEYFNDEGIRVVTKTSHDLLQLVTHPVYMQEVIDKGIEENDPVILDLFVHADVRSASDEEKFKERGEILSIKNGFGFIKYPNNNLFFHYQDIIGDFNELTAGQIVEFDVEKNSMKQDVAKNVRRVDSDIQREFDSLGNTF